MSKLKLLLSAGLLLQVTSSLAAEPTAEADLRKAAKLHLGGDTATAVQIWKKWAQQGDVDAAYNLGLVYQHADGVPYDPREAARWYRQAAEAGDKSAQFRLGQMYLRGEGVPRNKKIAHEWFTRHRRAHLHHHHDPQFKRWQEEARALIAARDESEMRDKRLIQTEQTWARIQQEFHAPQETLRLAQQAREGD